MPHSERFCLKGALLLTAWRAPVAWLKMDIDLLGRTKNDLDHVRTLVKDICELTVA